MVIIGKTRSGISMSSKALAARMANEEGEIVVIDPNEGIPFVLDPLSSVRESFPAAPTVAIFGEIHGQEAFDMIQAMNIGTCVSAQAPLNKLEHLLPPLRTTQDRPSSGSRYQKKKKQKKKSRKRRR